MSPSIRPKGPKSSPFAFSRQKPENWMARNGEEQCRRPRKVKQDRGTASRLRPEGGLIMLLEGKVAVVTGGGRGIGAAICRVLAREGAAVAVNYSASREKAEQVARQITEAGGQALAVGADVQNTEAVQAMVEQ